MKAVVFGAAGFIGRHLCRRLASSGEVNGFDVVAPSDLGFECRPCDVCIEVPDLSSADVVVYLSQSPHYRAFPARADHLFGVNTVGALRAAEVAARAGARLFVYASTGNVYAPSFEPLAEDSPVRRDEPYALSKLTAEDALRLRGGDMHVVCARLFGVFGPEQQSMLVPEIVARVRNGTAVTVAPHPDDPDDGGGLRISLTFVDDVVDALVSLSELSGPLPQVLNVAAPEAVSIRQLAATVGEHLEIDPVFESAAQPRASDLIANVGRLQDLIAPRFTDFGAAVARTLERE